MPLFEVCLPGWNGGTSDTDHLVKWVSAPNIQTVANKYPDARIEQLPREWEGRDDIDEVLN